MKRSRLFPVLLLSLALILTGLTGCGSRSGSSADSMSAAAAYPTEEYYYDEDYSYEIAAAEEAEVESAADSDLNETVLQASVERKLTYRANVTMETKDFRGALDSLDALISGRSGYVASSSVSDYGEDSDRTYARSAYYEVQVPAESLDAFLDDLRTIGNVLNVSKEVEDITTSYYNTQSRLDSLLKEEERMLELQEKAETLEDLLTIEEHLSSVRSEINYLNSMMQVYEKQVSYSSVTVNLEEVVDYSTVPVQDPTLGERIAEAFRESLSFFSDAGQGLIVGIVFMAPLLLLIAVIVAVIVVCVKAGRKKRARRSAGLSAKGQGNAPAQPVQPVQAQPMQPVQSENPEDGQQK